MTRLLPRVEPDPASSTDAPTSSGAALADVSRSRVLAKAPDTAAMLSSLGVPVLPFNEGESSPPSSAASELANRLLASALSYSVDGRDLPSRFQALELTEQRRLSTLLLR